MDEFKEFLKTIPSIKQDVLNGRYTWQPVNMKFLLCMVKMINFGYHIKQVIVGFDLNMLLEVIKNN